MVNIPLILSRLSDLDKKNGIQITKVNDFSKIKVTKLKLLPPPSSNVIYRITIKKPKRA